MDRNLSIITLIMIALTASALSSCISNMGIKGIRNSKNYLDWEGIYTNTILSGEGHYMDVRIRLKQEHSFEFYYGRADGAFDPFYWKGSFRWDETENIIMADINYVHHRYKVAKDKLIRLDMDNFVLEKEK